MRYLIIFQFSSAARDIAFTGRKLEQDVPTEIGEIQIVLESNQNVIPIRGLMVSHCISSRRDLTSSVHSCVSACVCFRNHHRRLQKTSERSSYNHDRDPLIKVSQAKGTRLIIVCKSCSARKTIECRPGFSGAQLPRTCDGGGS